MVIIIDAEKALDLVRGAHKGFIFENMYCPNPGAYYCDRRMIRRYIAIKNNFELGLIAGDRLIIEDGGNIAAGDEPIAWIGCRKGSIRRRRRIMGCLRKEQR